MMTSYETYDYWRSFDDEPEEELEEPEFWEDQPKWLDEIAELGNLADGAVLTRQEYEDYLNDMKKIHAEQEAECEW